MAHVCPHRSPWPSTGSDPNYSRIMRNYLLRCEWHLLSAIFVVHLIMVVAIYVHLGEKVGCIEERRRGTKYLGTVWLRLLFDGSLLYIRLLQVRMVMATKGGDEPPVSLKKFNRYIDSLSQGADAEIDWTNIPQTVFNVIIQVKWMSCVCQ